MSPPLIPLLLLSLLLPAVPQSSPSACSDYQNLTSFSSLIWLSKSRPAPWEIFPLARVYHSSCFKAKFNAFFATPVPGAPNVTFSSFLAELVSHDCLYYPHGGFVRDLINSKSPHDLDGQYSCPPELLISICDGLFGEGFASVDQNTSFFYLGNHSLEGFNWNDSFFNLEDQEYTPDSLYYDPLNEVLIDLSGKGLEDVLKGKIRIPVERRLWDRWLIKRTEDIFRKGFALRKVPRYWKLKSIGFEDYDGETISYLKREIAGLWDDQSYSMKEAFLAYICWVLDGTYSDFGCSPKEEAGFTTENALKCRRFVGLVMQDFSQMPGRILKDLNEYIKGTGCYSGRGVQTTTGTLAALFVLIFIVLTGFQGKYP